MYYIERSKGSISYHILCPLKLCQSNLEEDNSDENCNNANINDDLTEDLPEASNSTEPDQSDSIRIKI